ncbi:hypothetical protein ABH935_005444 [Catenulispora sp. GAS73]|uniref:hypothetical protein n=1 Tax=Catenulispora sp. GAS73 TaxID=3156269 RepID=UPI0035165EDD
MTAADLVGHDAESAFLRAVNALRAQHGRPNPLSDEQGATNVAIARGIAAKYGDGSTFSYVAGFSFMYSIAEQTKGLNNAKGFTVQYLVLVKRYFASG